MSNVELIYDLDCPNVPAARTALAQACAAVALPVRWREWNRADASTPAHARGYGSPSVLVDGRDVAGMAPSDAPSCRIYADTAGAVRGVPPVAMIVAALKNRTASNSGTPPKSLIRISTLPAIGTALLPRLTCPTCWPAYSAALGALGFGFVDYTPYLLPVMTIFVLLALAVIARATMRSRRVAPLIVGVVGAGILLGGRMLSDSDAFTYAGAALLAAASLWSTWRRRANQPTCGACDGTKTT